MFRRGWVQMKDKYEWLKSVASLQNEITHDTAIVWDALIENDCELAIRIAADMKMQADGIAKIADYLWREAKYELGLQSKR